MPKIDETSFDNTNFLLYILFLILQILKSAIFGQDNYENHITDELALFDTSKPLSDESSEGESAEDKRILEMEFISMENLKVFESESSFFANLTKDKLKEFEILTFSEIQDILNQILENKIMENLKIRQKIDLKEVKSRKSVKNIQNIEEKYETSEKIIEERVFAENFEQDLLKDFEIDLILRRIHEISKFGYVFFLENEKIDNSTKNSEVFVKNPCLKVIFDISSTSLFFFSIQNFKNSLKFCSFQQKTSKALLILKFSRMIFHWPS